MVHKPIFGAMLHFNIEAENKSEAWKILQRISMKIAEDFKEVEVKPFDIDDPRSSGRGSSTHLPSR